VQDRVIEIESLWVKYNELIVLEDINFSVRRGEIVSIVGPNGSGKTTLIKTILGFKKPFKGSVNILGRHLEGVIQSKQIGYLPQAGSFMRSFPVNVFDVVAMSFYARKKLLPRLSSADKDKIHSVLKKLNIDHLARTFFGDLSGGQKQRVLIARALVMDPVLLILDEPSTGLDAVAQGSFYKLLLQLRDGYNMTIIMVSHDVGAVSNVVDKIACLNRKIHFHGPPDKGIPEEAIRKVFGENVRFLFHDEACETCRRRK